MSRIIQEKIKKLIAEELLFGKLMQGGHFIVTEEQGDIRIEILENETEEAL